MAPASGQSFAISVGWRIALFVAVSLGFQAIVSALLEVADCSRVKGGCAIASVLGGPIIRPILVVILALALLRPTTRRARAIGGSGLAGPLVTILVLLDWQYLATLGSARAVSLDLGLLNVQLPFFAILALLLLVALALARPITEPREGLFRRHGSVGYLTMAGILGTAAIGALSVVLYFLWAGALGREGMMEAAPLYAGAFRVGRIATVVCLITLIPMAFIVLAEAFGRRKRRDEAA